MRRFCACYHSRTGMNIRATQRGMSLIEVLIGTLVFVMVAVAVYTVGAASIRAVRTYRERSAVAALADYYLEIARNLPYSQIGTINGNPSGSLADQPNAISTTYDSTPYKVYYVVNYVDDPADGTILAGTDPAPNDYKQIKVYIKNARTGVAIPFTTTISPKGLENLASGGALSIAVINAVGQPVPNATIAITNGSTTPHINLTRTADSTGHWIEVGLPDSSNSYHIVVTKSGYSSDQTNPISVQNPNPTKPDATISNGQVTQVSFSIDLQSSLVINALSQTCQPLSGIGVALKGTKLIGTPNVLKFSNTYTTTSNGQVTLNPLEWDNYTPGLTSGSYMIYGSSPIQQINLLPNTSQQSNLIIGPSTANSYLAIVKDSATGNPLEGASVELSDTNLGYDVTKLTAGSILYQQSWAGGSGQPDIGDATKYWNDDGNVNVAGSPTGIRLFKGVNGYVASGMLTSSSFDTGTAASAYTTLTWNPTSQSASTSVAFQIATNNDDATWNFIGPDGTSATYFTTPGMSMNAANNNNRYLRYRAYLYSTATTTTPVISNVTVNYVSGCFSPGQAMFAGLASDANYQLRITMPGYQTKTISPLSITSYNSQQTLLSQ